MKINDAINEFCTHLRAEGDSIRTVEVYRQRLFILIELGELENTQPKQIDYVIAKLWSDHAKATVAGHIQAIKAFFKWCVKRKLIAESPAGELKRPQLSYRADSKAINQGDLEQMIELARTRNNYLDYAMLMYMADTGCRVGELISLNLSSLNLDKLEAFSNGKTGEADFFFTQPTAEALRTWLGKRPNTDPDAVFTTHAGRVSIKRVYTGLKKLAVELGIKRYNPHSIRHRVGQGWIDQSANLEVVRQKLHHKNISTTAMIYGNQDKERIKRASKKYSLVKDI